MVKSVSLSDSAFAALREHKRDGESDSDVVLRLVREAQSRRDPRHFLRTRRLRSRTRSPEKHLEVLKEAKEKDRADAVRSWRKRHGDSGRVS